MGSRLRAKRGPERYHSVVVQVPTIGSPGLRSTSPHPIAQELHFGGDRKPLPRTLRAPEASGTCVLHPRDRHIEHRSRQLTQGPETNIAHSSPERRASPSRIGISRPNIGASQEPNFRGERAHYPRAMRSLEFEAQDPGPHFPSPRKDSEQGGERANSTPGTWRVVHEYNKA